MKIKSKSIVKIKGQQLFCCGNEYLYQLKGWDKDDWLCADCFLNELENNDYEIIPKELQPK